MVDSSAALSPHEALSQILKRLRRRRGLTAAMAADALGMGLRSYENFESSRHRINLPRILAAARLFKADPYILLLAADLGRPDLALRCADNQLGAVFSVALEAFDAQAGDTIVHLDAQTLLAAFTHTFHHLAAVAAQRDRLARARQDGSGSPTGQPPPEEPGADASA